MTLWLLATGLISILGQVVLLRELNIAFYGSELIYILALGAWLFWTAIGVALGRRAYLPSPQLVRILLVIFSLVLPLSVVFVRGTRHIWSAVPGAYLPFPTQLAALSLALLPVGVFVGLLFQWVAKLYVERGRTLAAAYAVESIGGLLGGVLATLFLLCGIQNWTSALICGLCSLAAACTSRSDHRPRWLAPVVIPLVGLLSVALVLSQEIDRQLTLWDHPQLLISRDSPYSRVTITQQLGQLVVFENGALSYESEGTTAEELVHLAALQLAAPESVLVLGGGAEGLVKEILRHQPLAVDYVELNGVLLELLSQHLPAELRASLNAQPVRTIRADPRGYLQSSPRYDLILVGMPEPASGQTNRFYTREFFALCAERLKHDGVLAFRLRAAENMWTPQLLRRTASIYRALQAEFTDVVVLPGVTNIILAADFRLPRDPQLLGERLITRKVGARLVSPAYVEYLYTNDRFTEIDSLLTVTEATANSDIKPVCYQFTLLIWLAKFFPVLSWLDWPRLGWNFLVRSPWTWLTLVVIVGGWFICRRWPVARNAALVAVAGFVGMVLETVLILQYQTASGVLYQNLGLLLMLFMAGLAGGAAFLDYLAKRAGLFGRTTVAWNGDPGIEIDTSNRKFPVKIGVLLITLFVIWCLLAAWLLETGAAGNLLVTTFLLFGCGFMVAAVFAFGSIQSQPNQRMVISPLYAADLLGGCFGSLVASLLLIPALGLAASALLMSFLLLTTFLLLKKTGAD